MEWIWKFEPLVNLLDHREPLVREWAMECLIALYPEQVGPVAVRYIADPVEGVARAALVHFIEHPDRGHAEVLLKAYSESSGSMAGLAASALSRLEDARLIEAFQDKYSGATREDVEGYALSVMHIASFHTPASAAVAAGALRNIAPMGAPDQRMRDAIRLIFSANLEAGNPIDPFFDFCFSRSDWRLWLPAWLAALGGECGTWYSESDLTDDDPPFASKKELPEFMRQSLDALAAAGLGKVARALEKSYRKRRYRDLLGTVHALALRMFQGVEHRVGAESFALWARGKDKPRQHLTTLDALNRHIHGQDPAAQKMMAKAALPILASLVELRLLLGVDIESLDRKGLLEAFLQERATVEEDRKIAARLRAEPAQGEIAEVILSFIEKDPDALAVVRALDYLAEGMDAHIAARLLKLGGGFELVHNLPMVIGRLGAPVLDLLPAALEVRNPDAVALCLELIRQLPIAGSADLLLKHWEHLWEWDKPGLLEALRGIGDRRFIHPLKRELKGIEMPEARTYQLLCLIHDVKDPLLKKIQAEVERDMRQQLDSLAAFEKGDLTPILDQPLVLDLKCRRCRKTYGYEVAEVTILSDAKGEYIIADHIRCKNCGAVDNYAKTPEADMAVMGRRLAYMAMGDEGLNKIEKGPLRFAASKEIGGKVRSIEEALQHYEELLAEKPGHVPHLIGYANTLRNAKRPDEAAVVYRKALESDSQSIEALVSLGQNAAAYGNLKEAYTYLEKAVTLLDSGNYYHVGQDLREFKEGIYDTYANAALSLGKIPQAPGRVSAEAPKKAKVGRNDPCPCGSGRKYKKCCLAGNCSGG